MPSGGNAAAAAAAAAKQLEEKNPVLQLNDMRKDCVYELLQEDGPSHEKRFTFKLRIDGKTFDGAGPTKKAAKAAAATQALKHPAVNANASKFKAQQSQKHQKNPNPYRPGAYGKKVVKPNQDDAIQYINGKQVCRFYLNSLCVRGKNCPYLHPEHSMFEKKLPMNPQVPSSDNYSWLQFCSNYLHLRCPRPDCKFLHVSKDDEEVYLSTGKIPAHIVEQAVRKAMVEDVAPPGVTQTCKAYLEGQCNWYSCPFRHLSRKDFSKEVLEALQNHFDRIFRSKGEYRLRSSRLLDSSPGLLLGREPYGYGSRRDEMDHRILGSRRHLDDRSLDFESRFVDRRDYERPFSADPKDLLVNGMQNMMVRGSRNDPRQQQMAMDELREELKHLHEENERLRRLHSVEEDNYFRRGIPQERSLTRSDFHKDESIYEEKMRSLKEENDEIRRLLLARERERPYASLQSDRRSYGNPMYGDSYYPDGMRRQIPESYNFDELLDSGMKEQMLYPRHGLGLPVATPKYPYPNQVKQQKTNKLSTQVYKFANIKKSGQNLQNAARPSFQVKFKVNTKKGNPQSTKKFYQKKPGQQQQKQKATAPQKQKTPPPQKQQNQNAKKVAKDKPVVTVKETKQESQSKEQREKKPKKATNETNNKNTEEKDTSVIEKSTGVVVNTASGGGEESSDDDVVIEEEQPMVNGGGDDEPTGSEKSEGERVDTKQECSSDASEEHARSEEEFRDTPEEHVKSEEEAKDAPEEHVKSEEKSKDTPEEHVKSEEKSKDTPETDEKAAVVSERWADAQDVF